ncbi:MAG: 4-alpha-glucanotransferase, partial [Chloroflexota bacterium]
MTSERSRLLELAALHSIQPWYQDAAGRHVIATTDSLLAALEALGADVRQVSDLEPALRARRAELAGELLEPVTVVWEDRAATVTARLRIGETGRRIDGTLVLEDGDARELSWVPDEWVATHGAEVDGQWLVTLSLALPDNLPLGYHRLELATGERSASTLMIVAPNRAYLPPDWHDGHRWGVFLPLYALHTSRSWGAGDYSDLHA